MKKKREINEMNYKDTFQEAYGSLVKFQNNILIGNRNFLYYKNNILRSTNEMNLETTIQTAC